MFTKFKGEVLNTFLNGITFGNKIIDAELKFFDLKSLRKQRKNFQSLQCVDDFRNNSWHLDNASCFPHFIFLQIYQLDKIRKQQFSRHSEKSRS